MAFGLNRIMAVLLFAGAATLHGQPISIIATPSAVTLPGPSVKGSYFTGESIVSLRFSGPCAQPSSTCQETFRVATSAPWIKMRVGSGPLTPGPWVTQPMTIYVSGDMQLAGGPGQYSGLIRFETSSGIFSTVSIAMSVSAPPPTVPIPKVRRIESSAYFTVAGLGPKTLVSLYGERLAAAAVAATELPLPVRLGSTEVFFCEKSATGKQCSPLQLLYVSPGQVNALLDFRSLSSARPGLAVRANGYWDETTVDLSTSSFNEITATGISPGVFFAGYDCPIGSTDVPCGLSATQQVPAQIERGTITNESFSVLSSKTPTSPGRVISIWMTGARDTSGQENEAERIRDMGFELVFIYAPAGSTVERTLRPRVLYIGNTPGSPGVTQLNVEVPPSIALDAGLCTSPREVEIQLRALSLSRRMRIPLRAADGAPECQ